MPGALMPGASPAYADTIGDARVSYSARVVARADTTVLRGRVFHAPGMQRRVQRTSDGLREIIIRFDLGLVWYLDRGRQTYRQAQLSRVAASLGLLDTRLVSLERGEEVELGGREVVRYGFRGRTAGGEAVRGRLWRTAKGLVVRLEGSSRRWGCCYRFSIELDDIRMGPQSPSLFRLPRGYRRVERRAR